MTDQPRVFRGARLLDADKWNGEIADILIVDGRIAEISSENIEVSEGTDEVNASELMIHPGLINGHTHGHGALAKGTGDRWTLELLLAAGPWITGNRSPEDRYLAAQLNAAEMALKGVTSCYDLFFELPTPTPEGITEAARAYNDVGVRVTMAPMVADRSLYEAVSGLMGALPADLRTFAGSLKPQPWSDTMASVKNLAKQWHFDSAWARLGLAPTIPAHCSDDLLTACRDLSMEYGLPLHSHVAESKVQLVSAEEWYGGSIVSHLSELGLITDRFTVAHGVWLSDWDMECLAQAGASVAVNPGSNMRLGNGVPDTRRMLDHGINVAIGTDGSNSSDNQNMYEAIRFAAYASRTFGNDINNWLTAHETLKAATTGGANATGSEGSLGTLQVGALADLVFLDLGSINWLPVNNPINQLVHTEDATAVRDVMVGGAYVVRDRALVNVDLASLADRAKSARVRLDEINLPNKQTFERLEPVVATYCSGLACERHALHRYCG
jgi:guanine deaminase